MFDAFFDGLATVLNFIYVLIPAGLRDTLGYGLAIMGLTVLVMTVITPLTVKSTKSMMQMQRLQPEMKKIQEKYKNDRETMNRELMAFYQEHSINPLGGCLPLLAQMPVLIIMYQLLRGLTVRRGGVGSGLGQMFRESAAGETITQWAVTLEPFRPDHLSNTTELYQSLRDTNDMNFLGMDLSISASQALQIGFVVAIPYFVLLAVILATGLYQNRQIQARNTSGGGNPQQQMLMKIMPFFLPIFSFAFPGGLALYWCTQNLCRIVTNSYITRSIYRQEQGDAIETTGTEKKTNQSSVKANTQKKSVKPAQTGKKSNGTKPANQQKKSQQTQSKQVKTTSRQGRRSGDPRATSPSSKKRK